MSIAYWCILAAAVLPYATIGVAKTRSRYDNSAPRRLDVYQGVAQRAHDAHLNGFEAFPFFAIGVVVASHASAHADLPLLDALAVAWIVVRLAYVASYLGDKASLRSLVWVLGFVLAAAIFTMPAWHG